MSCDTWREEMTDRVAGEISEERAILLEQHLAECPACTRQMRRLEGLVGSIRSCDAWEADPEMEDRLIDALRRQSASRAPVPSWTALWRWRVPAYAVLAIALVGVFAGTHLRRPGAPGSVAAPVGETRTAAPERTPPLAAPEGSLQASLPKFEFATTPSDAVAPGRLGSPDSL